MASTWMYAPSELNCMNQENVIWNRRLFGSLEPRIVVLMHAVGYLRRFRNTAERPDEIARCCSSNDQHITVLKP